MDRDLRLLCTGRCRCGERYRYPGPVRLQKSLFSLIRFEDELARALRMKVDLVTENAVSPYLADAICRDAVVIYDAGGSRISPSYP